MLNLAVVDAGALSIDLTPAVLVGYALRVGVLFAIGAFVAYLQGETDRFRAFQLGIAAPALLTGVINGHNVAATMPKTDGPHAALALVSEAYAGDGNDDDRDESPQRPERERPDGDADQRQAKQPSETFSQGIVRGILGRPSESAADRHDEQRGR